MYTVYILESEKNGRYYIGYTSDLEKREKDHNSGKNVSTKYGIPWIVVYSEKFEDKKSAWLRERQIKSFKHGEAFKKLIENCS
jgi:putative endonuclease